MVTKRWKALKIEDPFELEPFLFWIHLVLNTFIFITLNVKYITICKMFVKCRLFSYETRRGNFEQLSKEINKSLEASTKLNYNFSYLNLHWMEATEEREVDIFSLG